MDRPVVHCKCSNDDNDDDDNNNDNDRIQRRCGWYPGSGIGGFGGSTVPVNQCAVKEHTVILVFRAKKTRCPGRPNGHSMRCAVTQCRQTCLIVDPSRVSSQQRSDNGSSKRQTRCSEETPTQTDGVFGSMAIGGLKKLRRVLDTVFCDAMRCGSICCNE